MKDTKNKNHVFAHTSEILHDDGKTLDKIINGLDSGEAAVEKNIFDSPAAIHKICALQIKEISHNGGTTTYPYMVASESNGAYNTFGVPGYLIYSWLNNSEYAEALTKFEITGEFSEDDSNEYLLAYNIETNKYVISPDIEFQPDEPFPEDVVGLIVLFADALPLPVKHVENYTL